MIELILLITLFTRGLYYSGSEGYIFEGLRRWVAMRIFRLSEHYNNGYSYHGDATNLFKPIWGCSHCMNSFWGVLICLWAGSSVIEAVIAICCSVGLSFMLEKLTNEFD